MLCFKSLGLRVARTLPLPLTLSMPLPLPFHVPLQDKAEVEGGMVLASGQESSELLVQALLRLIRMLKANLKTSGISNGKVNNHPRVRELLVQLRSLKGIPAVCASYGWR